MTQNPLDNDEALLPDVPTPLREKLRRSAGQRLVKILFGATWQYDGYPDDDRYFDRGIRAPTQTPDSLAVSEIQEDLQA